MPTWTALTTLPKKPPAEALGEALEQLDPTPTGVGVFEMEDGSGLFEVGAYFVEPPDEVALAILAAAYGANDFAVSEVPDTDWVAHVRRELHPVEAGRFFLYGSHDADKVPEGSVPLLIEAAMAFGTGHHGTTKGCLEAVDKLFTSGFSPQSVADIGCGTAVLAIAAAKVLRLPVMASDIDPQAVDVALANAAANDVSELVSCVEAAGFDHPAIAEIGPYDLVFANILKGPLVELAPDVATHTKAGGYVILSGILNPQADDVIAAYKAQGLELHSHDQIGEWTTLTLRKAH
ncbi:50S ribosomal protein L11 methyltransferase [Rhodobacteraceae bacterium N5(2021)]|uniref:Ribosomal protein L11 methyltransferase n=1 Tax=Gymnodinialimonas phycosphaerae TaxID=2841589 RepID=A0A975TU82_9RHOB|nr:50S ribosomal protein L11 methyltransferase [Gymnodinialimonas phycosphaerae]MBY4895002.1 50S ribosomal protein L11 methyltransferase [Gymnodinialimonas phycosphaerae]